MFIGRFSFEGKQFCISSESFGSPFSPFVACINLSENLRCWGQVAKVCPLFSSDFLIDQLVKICFWDDQLLRPRH